jgi:hypothetical protein
MLGQGQTEMTWIIHRFQAGPHVQVQVVVEFGDVRVGHSWPVSNIFPMLVSTRARIPSNTHRVGLRS